MGLLDVVDEQDRILRQEDFIKIHSEGLRHRSVQIFVLESPAYSARLLVAERSGEQESSALKLHASAGGHVKTGQAYIDAAAAELREELFSTMEELPEGITLCEMARYKNDTRPTNKENTCLFSANYQGPFFPNSNEISRIYWQDPCEIRADMMVNQDKYTQSFRIALSKYLLMIYGPNKS